MKINFQNLEYNEKWIKIVHISNLLSRNNISHNSKDLKVLASFYSKKPSWIEIKNFLEQYFNKPIANIPFEKEHNYIPSPNHVSIDLFRYGFQQKEMNENINEYLTKYKFDKILTPIQIRDLITIYPEYYKQAYHLSNHDIQHEVIFTKEFRVFLPFLQNESNTHEINSRILEVMIELGIIDIQEVMKRYGITQ